MDTTPVRLGVRCPTCSSQEWHHEPGNVISCYHCGDYFRRY